MAPADKLKYFKKLKFASLLAIMSVGSDAMAGWDGAGPLPEGGATGAAVNAYNEWAKSAMFKEEVEAIGRLVGQDVASILPAVGLGLIRRGAMGGVTFDGYFVPPNP